MKLRIRANSLRLRLLQAEVRQLAEQGLVEEHTRFGPSTPPLVYALRAADVPALTACFAEGRIVICIPTAALQNWATGDDVGIEAAQPIGPGETLRILIEKDFVCLDGPPDDSQADAFPHPRGAKC